MQSADGIHERIDRTGEQRYRVRSMIPISWSSTTERSEAAGRLLGKCLDEAGGISILDEGGRLPREQCGHAR
jgi:hypothetical protein